MATEKFIKAKAFSEEELQSELQQATAQYRKLKFDHAIKGLDNPRVLVEIRRDIARLKTEVRRRELEAMTPEQKAKRDRIIERRK